MKHALARHILRLLIICVAVFPFSAYAGMVGTEQVAAAAQAAGVRDQLRTLLGRSEVSDQLQSLGISPAAAQARVNAMTDTEVANIAGRLDRLPAGGLNYWAVGAGLLVIELIWYFWVQ